MNPLILGFRIEHLEEGLREKIVARPEPVVVAEVAGKLLDHPGAHVLPQLHGEASALNKVRERHWSALRLLFSDEELLTVLRRELTHALVEHERMQGLLEHTPADGAPVISGASEYDEPCEDEWCMCYEDPDPDVCEDPWDEPWGDCEEEDCDEIVLDPLCFECWGEDPDGSFAECEWVPCDDGEPFLCC